MKRNGIEMSDAEITVENKSNCILSLTGTNS